MGNSLIIRKRRDGSSTLEGALPDQHVFSARWIERELGDLVSVQITVTTDGTDSVYELTGFEQNETEDGSRSNFTGWRADRVTNKKGR